MVELLAKREAQMREGGSDEHPTDRWQCYSCIIDKLASDDGRPLRLMIQASAGTGKSFLLTTVFLCAICNDKKCKAAPPTGIAAGNIEIENTNVGPLLANPKVLWGQRWLSITCPQTARKSDCARSLDLAQSL